MKLCDWRKEYEEYDDMTDEEVLSEFDVEPDDEKEFDTVTPALYDIEAKLESLCTLVGDITIPDLSDVIKQIKNQLKVVETAIKGIDVNVTLPAPIVNIPPQPEIKIPTIVIPKPLKEWSFSIVRDRNGYIAEIIAKGN